jgi:hypothetical protein
MIARQGSCIYPAGDLRDYYVVARMIVIIGAYHQCGTPLRLRQI